MIDLKRPETDPAETPPGERSYEDLPVSGTSQGPLSQGATEPGDIGGARHDEKPRPPEHPHASRTLTEGGSTDESVQGATGHEAFDKARAESQQRK